MLPPEVVWDGSGEIPRPKRKDRPAMGREATLRFDPHHVTAFAVLFARIPSNEMLATASRASGVLSDSTQRWDLPAFAFVFLGIGLAALGAAGCYAFRRSWRSCFFSEEVGCLVVSRLAGAD